VRAAELVHETRDNAVEVEAIVVASVGEVCTAAEDGRSARVAANVRGSNVAPATR